MKIAPVRPSRHEPIQHRGHRTRQKVLRAARKILVRKGYQAARVEEITKLAQVGYGTFYKYFRNKQDVLEAVMEEVYLRISEENLPEHVDPSRIEDQIREGITNYLQAYRRNSEVLLALQPASMMSPRIRTFLANLRERDAQWMVRALQELSRQGWKIEGNAEVLSLSMLHMVEFIAQDWVVRRQHLQLEEVAETLCEIWFRVLLPSRPMTSYHQETGEAR